MAGLEFSPGSASQGLKRKECASLPDQLLLSLPLGLWHLSVTAEESMPLQPQPHRCYFLVVSEA